MFRHPLYAENWLLLTLLFWVPLLGPLPVLHHLITLLMVLIVITMTQLTVVILMTMTTLTMVTLIMVIMLTLVLLIMMTLLIVVISMMMTTDLPD